jgi:hypothetical protein
MVCVKEGFPTLCLPLIDMAGKPSGTAILHLARSIPLRLDDLWMMSLVGEMVEFLKTITLHTIGEGQDCFTFLFGVPCFKCF